MMFMAVLEILKVNLLLNVDHQLFLFSKQQQEQQNYAMQKKAVFSVIWVLMEILRAWYIC